MNILGTAIGTSVSVANELLTYSYTDEPPPTRTMVELTEGEEPGPFWAALGGKTEYATLPEGELAPREARLFECSTATGRFAVDEVTRRRSPKLDAARPNLLKF